jgi:hypothetical protein
MKKLLTLALALACLSLMAQPAGPGGHDYLENTLNVAAHSLDGLMLNTLGALELIAATPEAKQGDWNGIKPYLQKQQKLLAGAYFFALPDGNYYTVQQDLTNLNLSSREYFPSLMAGKQVWGFPIHSRSTDKKSALLACPVRSGDKVTGALGASVFLDELQRKINDELRLPDNCTWFVVDSSGLTMLDREPEYIFMNALTEGSASLKGTLEQAFKAEQGRIDYELGGLARKGFFRRLPHLDWWMVMVRKEGQTPPPNPKLEFSLKQFTPELQKTLNRIDNAIASAVLKAKDTPQAEKDIRSLMSSIYRQEEALIDIFFIDGKGIMRYAEPKEYRNYEGSDFSGQAHVADMIKKPRPLLSSGFTAVEGFDAVTFCHPLYGKNGEFIGYLSALVRPDLVVRKLLKSTGLPPEYDLWIMQTDGRVVYDQDAGEIGRMLFSDPLYAPYVTLLKLGRNIAATSSGTGDYIFEQTMGKENVIKKASWDTVKLHGTEWRVVLTYLPYKN